MTPLEYFSSFTSLWKITVGLILFCIWQLSAYLVFHYHIDYFVKLDILKLSLLTSAMTSPFIIINSGLTLLLLFPGNKELRKQRDNIEVIPVTGFLAVAITSFILSLCALMAFLNASENAVEITMASIQGVILLIVIYSAIRERA